MTTKKKTKFPSQEWINIKSTKRDRLISERQKLGLTQKEFADLFNVSKATISHLENGRTEPNLDLSIAIPEKLSLPFETLFPDS